MHLVVMFILICIIAIAFAIVFKYRIEQTLSIACFALTAILYAFGLFGILAYGVYACFAACLGALAFIVRGVVKGSVEKKFITRSVLTPGFAVFCVFYVIMCFLHRNRTLNGWDEFSHWGLVVKNMHLLDALGNHPHATTLLTGYPPGVSLFHYLWMKICGYSESNFYISMNVLAFSLVLPVFKGFGWRDKALAAITALIVFILPLGLFESYYTSIYVDGFLGAMLAYILFIYYTEKDFRAPFFINLFLAMAAITLAKSSGFGLAIIAALIIAIDLFIKSRLTRKAAGLTGGAPQKNRLGGMLASKPPRLALFAFIAPVLAHLSWSVYLSAANTYPAWNTSALTPASVLELFTRQAPTYRYFTIISFVRELFARQASSFNVKLTYIQWAVLLLFVFFALYSKSGTDFKRKVKTAFIGLFTGAFLYAVSLCALYAFTYTEFEATVLASFERYMNCYLFAALLLPACLSLYYLKQESAFRPKNPPRAIAAGILAALMFFINIFNPLYNLVSAPPDISAVTGIRRILSLPLDSKTDALYYIAQNTNGLERFIAQYEITPIKMQPLVIEGQIAHNWSIGTPYGENDVLTLNIACAEWLETLKNGYSYVYLEKIDEQFIEEFGAAFENQSEIMQQALYSVEDVGGRTVLRLAF